MSTMSPDDHEEDETDGEEPWNPEDDKVEKDYMKLARQFMKAQLEALSEAKQNKKGPQRQSPIPQGMGLGALVALGSPSPQGIQFRRIENGFLMTYTQVKEAPCHGAGILGQPLPLPAGAPEGLGAALAALPHVHRVEVFVKDAAEAQPHLVTALASLEKLAKLPSSGFFM